MIQNSVREDDWVALKQSKSLVFYGGREMPFQEAQRFFSACGIVVFSTLVPVVSRGVFQADAERYNAAHHYLISRQG